MMNVSVSNKHNTTWKMHAVYSISEIAVFVSEISLFRFLEVCQQLVRKYRTPALSMKYSICTTYVAGAWK